MKILNDLIPLVLFFGVYWLSGNIFLATQTLMVAMVTQILYSLARRKKISSAQWVSLALVMLLGGATLHFHSSRFIMWKPTLLYWLIALGLLVGMYFKKNGIRCLLSKELQLTESLWTKLNIAWAIFFALLGALNLGVAYLFSEAVWVNFKVFGCLGLMVAFVVVQSVILCRISNTR